MRDVTEFLDELGLVAPFRELPLRVTYQDSCHLLHGQKIREAPAAPDSRHSWSRASGDAPGGSLLRLGGGLQRDANRNFLAVAGGKDAHAPRRPKREPSSPRIRAAFCKCAPGAKSTVRARRCCTSSSCSTAPSRQPRRRRLLLANKVAASRRPHARRVHVAGRNIAALSRAIRCALAAHRQRHLSFENDVRGLHGMRMLRIALVGPSCQM